MTCKACGHPLRGSTKRIADAPGTRQHAGRGLCAACHKVATDQDSILDHGRINRTWEELIDDLEVMLERTTDPAVIVATLRMTPTAIARAAHRHGRTDLARPFWAYRRRIERKENRERAS